VHVVSDNTKFKSKTFKKSITFQLRKLWLSVVISHSRNLTLLLLNHARYFIDKKVYTTAQGDY